MNGAEVLSLQCVLMTEVDRAGSLSLQPRPRLLSSATFGYLQK